MIWDGITGQGVLDEGSAALRHRLADAAKAYDWPAVLTLLREHRSLVNTTRPGGSSLFAPLHQAAHGDAPAAVCKELVQLGAWCMLQNARGERPIDIAEHRGHAGAAEILRPQLKRRVPFGILMAIQAHFHAVIRERADDLVRRAGLRLPELGPLLELPSDSGPIWFAVPGMYGGFSYRLTSDGVEATIVAESWCRVVGGSGQRHVITSAGSQLVDEGFV